MATYVQVSDVRGVWDGDATDERIQALLDQAEARLLNRVNDLADRIADGRTNEQMVPIVLADMVIRHLNNPMGFQSEHAGEVGYSFGTNRGPSGRIAVTDDDLAQLGIVTGYRPRSVRMKIPRQYCGSPWS